MNKFINYDWNFSFLFVYTYLITVFAFTIQFKVLAHLSSELVYIWSRRSEFVVIRGGNHCGCAHYGPQTWPAGDGDRTITLDEQQRILVNNTVAFLEGEPLPNAGPSRKEWKET